MLVAVYTTARAKINNVFPVRRRENISKILKVFVKYDTTFCFVLLVTKALNDAINAIFQNFDSYKELKKMCIDSLTINIHE